MSTFKIGEKVVCVDDSNQDSGLTVIGAGCVKRNEIYTIDGFTYLDGLILKEVECGFFKYSGKIGGFKPEFCPFSGKPLYEDSGVNNIY